MESKKHPKADLNRKKTLFLALGFVMSLTLTLTAFEWKKFGAGEMMDLGMVSDDFEELTEIPPTEQPPKTPPKIQQPQIVEIPDDEEIIEEIEIDLDVDITEETQIEDIVFEDEPEEEKGDDIFMIVEEPASFPGGNKAWGKFLKKNLRYPRNSQRMGLEGKVFLSFIVAADGSLSNITVSRGLGGGLDEEAVRVLKKSPKWNPGKQRGRPVKSPMAITVIFTLR